MNLRPTLRTGGSRQTEINKRADAKAPSRLKNEIHRIDLEKAVGPINFAYTRRESGGTGKSFPNFVFLIGIQHDTIITVDTHRLISKSCSPSNLERGPGEPIREVKGQSTNCGVDQTKYNKAYRGPHELTPPLTGHRSVLVVEESVAHEAADTKATVPIRHIKDRTYLIHAMPGEAR
jgi:hypothetical protein